jgi:hypothetical protein
MIQRTGRCGFLLTLTPPPISHLPSAKWNQVPTFSYLAPMTSSSTPPHPVGCASPSTRNRLLVPMLPETHSFTRIPTTCHIIFISPIKALYVSLQRPCASIFILGHCLSCPHDQQSYHQPWPSNAVPRVFFAADKLETIPSRTLDVLTKKNGDGDRSATSIVRFPLQIDPLGLLDGFRQRAHSS